MTNRERRVTLLQGRKGQALIGCGILGLHVDSVEVVEPCSIVVSLRDRLSSSIHEIRSRCGLGASASLGFSGGAGELCLIWFRST